MQRLFQLSLVRRPSRLPIGTSSQPMPRRPILSPIAPRLPPFLQPQDITSPIGRVRIHVDDTSPTVEQTLPRLNLDRDQTYRQSSNICSFRCLQSVHRKPSRRRKLAAEKAGGVVDFRQNILLLLLIRILLVVLVITFNLLRIILIISINNTLIKDMSPWGLELMTFSLQAQDLVSELPRH